MFVRITAVLFTLLCFFASASHAEKLQLTIESASGAPKGVVTIGLLADKAPNHVARIKKLTEEGAYNGVIFHRVIPGFMAQTGDVEFGNVKKLKASRAGTGGSQYDDLKAEFSDMPFTRGVVGMARSRYVNSANSQFFIMTDAHSSLDGSYTVVGFVLEGMDVVNLIKSGTQGNNGKVTNPDVIKSALIVE